MRKLLLLAFLFMPLASLAQQGPIPGALIDVVQSPPSGSCFQDLPDQQVAITGALYSCQNGTWALVANGGGGGTPSGPAGGGLSGTYPNPSIGATISVMSHGASCNWNGTTGTDDTPAFQESLTLGGTLYAITNTPVKVTYPTNCTLGTGSGQTTITLPSGVTLDGSGGSIFVPAQSANPLFESLSAGATQFNNNNITFVSNLTGCAIGVNNAACATYRWDSANPGTSTTYNDFTADGNKIYNAGWGILVGPQAGTDCLQHVHINNNTIGNLPGTGNYAFNDAIHLGGCISNFEVTGNIIQGRHDAGIAVTSEVNGSSQLRQCQNGTIASNSIYENAVGIDISGCSHVQVTGNWVWADQAISASNPAFRQIYYNALPSYNNISGNTFQNYQGSGTDYGAKFDCSGGCGNNAGTIYYSYSSFTDNRIPNLYVRGSGISVSGNTFQNNIGSAGVGAASTLEIDWDSTNGNGSLYTMIGPNTWMNNGNVNTDSRSDIYFGSIYYPQIAKTGTITLYYPAWAQSPDMTIYHNYFGQLVQNSAVATPTVTTGAGAGTGPTLTFTGSTDQAGTIFLTAGTSPTANATVFTVTFQNYFASATPRCSLTPANAVTTQLVGAAAVYLGGPGQGEGPSAIYATSGVTPLQAGASYEWTWLCIG